MNEETATSLLDELAKGNRSEVFVDKNDFLDFQKVLVKRPDFKHFRGIAQRGGHVIYQYLEEARS